MRARTLLLLGILLVPAASACSYALPSAFEHALAWHPDHGIVGTTQLFWTGPLVDGVARSAFPEGAILGPEGAIAFPMQGAGVQEGPARVVDTCGGHYARYLVGRASPEAPFVIIDKGPVWSLASVPEGILSIHEDEVRVYGWSDFRLVRTLSADGIAERAQWSRAHVASPDGRWLVDLYPTTRLYELGTTVRAVRALDDAGSVSAVSFSPDSRHLAIVFADERYGMRVEEVATGNVTSRVPLPGAYRSVAWAEHGLAALVGSWGSPTTTLRVHQDPVAGGAIIERAWPDRAAGALAWSPDGDEMVVSFPESETHATLAFLSPSLETLREERVRVEPGDSAWILAAVARQAPTPEPERPESRPVPAPPLGGALALAVALGLVFRGGLSRRG